MKSYGFNNNWKIYSKKRKVKNLTQLQLAERLYVTDRAVSKWECGRSLPDSSIMLELCEILEISVNELLTGKELEMENYNKQAELNLLEAIKQKEESDKRLLRIEIIIGVPVTILFLALLFVAVYGHKYGDLPLWAMIVMVSLGSLSFLVMAFLALRIEQKAGYYECKQCGHRHIPTYAQVFFAPHINRSRWMKCPHCGKRTYQKKVISKNKS